MPAAPTVRLRTCATASSVGTGLPRTWRASELSQAGAGASSSRAKRPLYRASPHPSEWGAVRPPRIDSAVNEKTISVGTLHSIPSSSHIGSFSFYVGGALAAILTSSAARESPSRRKLLLRLALRWPRLD